MRPLAVLDLDGTLLPYDSLRRYCLRLLSTAARWEVIGALLRRSLRLDSPVQFLDRLDRAVAGLADAVGFHRRFAEELRHDLSPDVLSFIAARLPADAVTVLCSASPERYVRHLCSAMGWQCVASGRREGTMVRVHGNTKVQAIASAYPSSTYRYAFAIADSDSDMPLLAQFESAFRVTNAERGLSVAISPINVQVAGASP